MCAIDEFPADGCGEPVKTVSAAAKTPDQPVELAMPTTDKAASDAAPASADSDSSHLGTWVAIGVVVLVAAAIALIVARRRRSA